MFRRKSRTVRKPLFRPNLVQLECRDVPAALTVNTNLDGINHADSLLTLREAVAAVNAGSSAGFSAEELANITGKFGTNNRIPFDTSLAGKTITLTGGELLVSKAVSISGLAGTSGITISGNNASRIFTINDSTAAAIIVSLTNLTLSGGNSTSGGAINNNGDNLTVANCTIENNITTTFGGGILSTGPLTLSNCTISNNKAGTNGGGVNANSGGTITNCTIAFNIANTAGATSGGSGLNASSLMLLNNTIVVGNTQPDNSAHDLSSAFAPASSNNLIGDAATAGGFVNGVNGNIVGVADAKLGAIASNGGPTQTFALLVGSPAIDKGNNAAAAGLTSDQRGSPFVRIFGGTIDIGAFELQPPPPISRNATGANAAAIQAAVDAFRADLGGKLNPNVLGSFETGRREINWDGVPDSKSSPTNLPLDFFNTPTSPRGAVFATPGTGVLVSQDNDSPTDTDPDLVRFSDIQSGYDTNFATFTAQRLFTAQGSNVVDVNFFVPGTTLPATVRGFGSVFTDVDDATSTSIEFFNVAGVSIFKQSVAATAGNAALSFAGASFDATSGITIAKVRIISGNGPLGTTQRDISQAGVFDLVAMDDFIYGEPQSVTPLLDFGDAPDSFGTTLANNGARHTAVGPFLGTTRNVEADGQPSANADAATDDDGATFLGAFTAGGTTTIRFGLTDPNGAAAVSLLTAFFDWNGDGDFLDGGESAIGQVQTNLLNELPFAVPADAKVGPTIARFRVSSQGSLATSDGQFPDGEVEDYRITVNPLPTIRSSAGADPASIQASVDAFRTDLGTLNANKAGSFANGRREINWDGVPDAKSAPNNLPADFFNSTSPRGAVFSFAAGSKGTGFQVSANAANPTGTPVEFGNLNAQYPGIFQPFSAQRLFTTLGDNAYEVKFFVPGTSIPATVSGFGAVFVNVDITSTIEYFDAAGKSFGVFRPQVADNGLSFLGVNFTQGERIAKVVLKAGDTPIGPTDLNAATFVDIVVFDDFIYSEPQAIVNTPPTVSDVGNQSALVNIPIGPVAFTINDAETALANLTVSVKSSNATLFPTGSLVLGGTDGNRTVTLTPASGQFGTATITLTVTDLNGATATDTFNVTINTPPTPPLLTAPSGQTSNEGASVAFGLGSLSDGNNSGNYSLTVNWGDGTADTKFTQAAVGTLAKQLHTYAQDGAFTAKITANDADGTSNVATFAVTVANVLPVVSKANNQTATTGLAQTFQFGSFTDPGADAPWTVSVDWNDGSPVVPFQQNITGAFPDRTHTFSKAGTFTATVTVTDDDGSSSAQYQVTVADGISPPPPPPPLNTPPSIGDVANQSTNGAAVGPLAFAVNDIETPVGSLVVTGLADNATLISSVIVGGSGANRTVLVTPIAGQSGTATITLTVQDGNGNTATDTFAVTVDPTSPPPPPPPPLNAPPTISDVANQASNGSTIGPIAFTVGDAETTADGLVETAQSNNTTLVNNVILGGSGANRTVTFTPVAGQFGTAILSLTVRDAQGAIATDTFQVTISAPPPTTVSPVLIGFPQFAVGADVGAGSATLSNPDSSVRFSVAPFGNFTGGVRTATADFNGDGVADLIVGTGPGRATRVVILDGKTQAELFSVDPFEASFTGGVYVSAGDVTGDGIPDLAITPDEGGGPRVDVYSGAVGFPKLTAFFGIDDTNFRGGARSAIADMTGDGVADLIVVAGFGGGPRVAGFDGKSIAGTPVKIFGDFFAFEQALRNGIFVTAGDLNGDGFADLIAGGGPGGGPRVLAFDGKSLLNNEYVNLANFFGGNVDSRGGIRVAVKDLDGDNRADLVVGSGAGAGSRVTGYLGKNIGPSGTPTTQFDFDSISGFNGGVFVG